MGVVELTFALSPYFLHVLDKGHPEEHQCDPKGSISQPHEQYGWPLIQHSFQQKNSSITARGYQHASLKQVEQCDTYFKSHLLWSTRNTLEQALSNP